MRPLVEDSSRQSIAPRLIAIIAAAVLPALILLPAELRPTILRAALVAGLAIALFHLAGRLLAALRHDDPDGFDQALTPPSPPVRLDAALGQIRNDIRYARSSRRYFEKILWPRLRTLAVRSGQAMEDLPPPPPTGWNKRRGPSLAELARLVDHLEKRR